MRFIDADSICVCGKYIKTNEKFEPYIMIDDLVKLLNEQQTAYDVDKVVNQLKTDFSVKLYGSGNSDNYLIPVNKAIEIVKHGGVSDDVCEWKLFDNSLTNVPQLVYETTCGKYVGEEHTSKAFVYCPYCSKKIYAVNVEQKLELKHL